MIKPLVMMLTTDDEKISRAPVANIPVFRFGGGGFFIRAPIKPGDFGWLKASDRDISLIFQRGGLEDQPNTTRLHSF
ncbi:Gp138 family membrane-puncturing spike protein, partial [Vibrio cholerae]